jgi:hypothetical protein
MKIKNGTVIKDIEINEALMLSNNEVIISIIDNEIEIEDLNCVVYITDDKKEEIKETILLNLHDDDYEKVIHCGKDIYTIWLAGINELKISAII